MSDNKIIQCLQKIVDDIYSDKPLKEKTYLNEYNKMCERDERKKRNRRNRRRNDEYQGQNFYHNYSSNGVHIVDTDNGDRSMVCMLF